MNKLFVWTQVAEMITAGKICQNWYYGITTYINNQIASDVWDTDNTVHKLTTDNPQAVLINVLIRAIFEH